MTDATDRSRRYFERAVSPDRDAYVGLFAADAVVEDDGRTYVGLDAIRAWSAELPPVSYTVTDESDDAGLSVVAAAVSGDFPGSPVALTFVFAYAPPGLISSLRIRA